MLSIAGELGRRSQRQHPRTCSLTPQMPYHTGARAGDMWGPDMPSQLLPASSARRLRTFPMETGHIGASRVCWATSTRRGPTPPAPSPRTRSSSQSEPLGGGLEPVERRGRDDGVNIQNPCFVGMPAHPAAT